MATWKQVLTSDSTINIEQIDGIAGNGDDNNSVVIIDGNNDADAIVLGDGQILVGTAGAPVAEDVTGGDVTGAVDGGNFVLSIGSDKITHGMLKEDIINVENIAPSNTFSGGSAVAGVMVFGNGTSASEPTFLSASGQGGKLLKVNAAANGFEFAAASDATNAVNVSSATTALPVIFGGTNADSNDTGVTLEKQSDPNQFTYEADATFAVPTGFLDGSGSTATVNSQSQSGGTAALTVAGGISGNLLGTALSAIEVGLHTDGTPVDAFHSVAFGGTADGYSPLQRKSGFEFNPAEETLRVKNLMVTGTNTTINTTNLNVDDQTIRVGTSLSTVTPASAQGGGLVVNVGIAGSTSGDEDTLNQTNDDDHLPRVIWGDQGLAASTLGWQIANVGAQTANLGDGADANTRDASNAWGVAVMYHNSTSGVTSANNADAAVNSGNGIGVGALYLNTNTDTLWIQTAV